MTRSKIESNYKHKNGKSCNQNCAYMHATMATFEKFYEEFMKQFQDYL